MFSGERETDTTATIPDFKSALYLNFDSSGMDVISNLQLALQITLAAIEELPLISKATKALTFGTFAAICGNLFGVDMFALNYGHSPVVVDQGSTDKQEQEQSVGMPKLEPAMPSPNPSLKPKQTVESASDDDANSIKSIDSTDDIANLASTFSSLTDITVPNMFETVLDADAWSDGDISTKAEAIHSSLGPSGSEVLASIPRTHEAGVAELSLRRIREIVYPATNGYDSNSIVAIESELDADSVEDVLSTRLVKVILDPWVGWETKEAEPDLFEPRILRRGATGTTDGTSDHAKKKEEPGLKHDPLQGSITVLLEPDCSSALRVGMGLGAIWVEMARASGSVSCGDTVEPKADRNKDVFWYMADMKVAVPSYYAAN